ncbi:MAG TPA: spondin domain-containing protein [Kofleriaceae bacterium]|nr:spondin domain-containing protein [Kofleriaceae bacterium]
MKFLASSMCALALAAACGDGDNAPVDDPDDPPPSDSARQFTMRIENVAPWHVLKLSSARTRTTGAEGRLNPGDAYDIRFTAAEGHRLSFAMMMLDTNDWFFAPDPAGIPLFDNGVPLTGDITDRIQLWDAGTEFDQEPAVGDATGIRQASSITGDADPNNVVRLVPVTTTLSTGATFTRPEIAQMIQATLSGPDRDGLFTLHIQNVSTTGTLVTSIGTRAVHLSPVVWALHRDGTPFFDANMPVRANQIDYLVEAGQPDPLIDSLRYERGVATGLSPGVFVIHRDDAPLFLVGAPDYGIGLEPLAEDGDPSVLYSAMREASAGMFDTPVDGVSGPAFPGQAYEVTFEAQPGDRVSFATMFESSNDWFFAPKQAGIELFLGNDPRWGDVTSEVALYDLGTESDQELDIGTATAVHQTAPNTGGSDGIANVREVPLRVYDVPEAYHIRVTLTPAEL